MRRSFFILMSMIAAGCTNTTENSTNGDQKVKIITLDPGHFHSALVQKSMYPDVDSVVYVYAPKGTDVELHLQKIETYNSRVEDPTHWKEEVYLGDDFFDKMLSEKKGNVVMLAGNNLKKTEYIKRSIDAGFNVYADKPMAIDSKSFEELKSAFSAAEKNELLLYDIMTERFEITTMLQKEFSLIPEVFGTLEKGTPDNPSVTKESIHHFYKYVSGSVLTRPAWFMDVAQEGEGIVDVTTHLVDLIQWECFPDQVIDYKTDIKVNSARRWSTDISLSQFSSITKMSQFPDYLNKYVAGDSILKVFSNGEINYKLRDVHARVSVKWAFKAPEGAADTHYSIMRGTMANLVIRQGAEQQYKPALYIEPVGEMTSAYSDQLTAKLKAVQLKYPGVELKKQGKGWEVIVPEKYKEGHESHFARVTEKFLEYLKKGNMPAWEVPNMIAKYYTTTQGLEVAKKNK
ncbi:MAG: putative oxidoreductase C-terminal domain-containing protein [Daejeonella sp.]